MGLGHYSFTCIIRYKFCHAHFMNSSNLRKKYDFLEFISHHFNTLLDFFPLNFQILTWVIRHIQGCLNYFCFFYIKKEVALSWMIAIYLKSEHCGVIFLIFKN